jgi:hypothetical protein
MKLRLLLLLAAVVGGWLFASPWYTMWRIVTAAEDGDSAALEERIDFERLQDSMQADLAVSRNDGDTDLLDRIGDGIVRTVGGAAIDTMVTPRGLAVLLDASTVVPGEDYSWDVERDGFNQFRAVSTVADGSAGPVMTFERDGLGWQLVRVAL